MASYIHSSFEVFNSKTSTGEWTIDQAVKPWNAFNAVAYIKDKNNKEYKIIIVNYFLNQNSKS